MVWTSGARADTKRSTEARQPRLLSPAELRQAVRSANPSVVFVSPRILRRVIREHRELPGMRLHVPHRKSYEIRREPLLEIVDSSELELAPGELLPECVVLLPQPDPEELAETPAEAVLLRYWRLLFHAAIHVALEERIAIGELTPAILRQSIQRIGPVEFDEARTVLEHDGFLLPPGDAATLFVEFAAVFLELRSFARGFLPRFFPGIEDPEAVAEVLQESVDATRLLAATRPQGAPDPQDDGEVHDPEQSPSDPDSQPASVVPASGERSERAYRLLVRRAEAAEARGNAVRAMLLWTQAKRVAPPARAGQARTAVRNNLDALIRRLQTALELGNDDARPWREPLMMLVDHASHGIWTREGRLLYDLQKVCVDHERNVFTVDLVGWALSLGRQPLKRPLPSQRDVLMARHLHSAMRRLAAVRLSDHHRRRLLDLFRGVTERAEERLRQEFRPVITGALDEVGLAPKTVPETVARGKLVEELLDRIPDRGFLTMGDLRDALARNDLKLPDLSGPSECLRGDPLLRADRRLATALDGVHRRGEIYLRWMQRLSGLAFGTPIGRFLTRFVVVPFGGAFVAIAGTDHLVAIIEYLFGFRESTHVDLPDPLPVILLGTFLLALIQWAAFRRGVWGCLKGLYFAARYALSDLPRKIIQSPPVQYIVRSRPWRLSYRFLLKPAVWTALVVAAFHGELIQPRTSIGNVSAVFLVVNMLLNSRLGRDVEEIALEWLALLWQRLGLQVLARLFWLVMELFQGLLQAVERLLYTVDEWLRFRSGQGRTVFVFKAVLGALWFFVTYVVRFCVNVLIEPQINPVKHFPVVTVSHKVLFFFIPYLASLFSLTMEKGFAITLATAIIWCIPGIFGFLVWELRTNWRLYAANHPPRLQPAPIGSHAETMLRFLKPGFHSGTVPKRYARLRRAERRARAGGRWTALSKHLQKLHGVERDIRRYVQRQLIGLMVESGLWPAGSVRVGRLLLATNRVRIELFDSADPQATAWIGFSLGGDWIVAHLADRGLCGRLSQQQRDVLTTAILGLYKMAGVNLVRQQVDDQFPPPTPLWHVDRRGLIVWPDPSMASEVLYELDGEAWLVPQAVDAAPPRTMPVLDSARLDFAKLDISWQDWNGVWEEIRSGHEYRGASLLPVRVLPLG
jgi:hypothetical protein